MTTTTLTERTVRVADKEIFFAEAGAGPVVVMLHGGGPGASGVTNYSRNIDALSQRYRVIVPDMPGYGRSVKGIDKSDPFGYLGDAIRGLLDELGIDTAHLVGNSYGGAAALRLALDTPHRVGKLVLMGPGGIGTTRMLPTAGLNSLLSYYGGAKIAGVTLPLGTWPTLAILALVWAMVMPVLHGFAKLYRAQYEQSLRSRRSA